MLEAAAYIGIGETEFWNSTPRYIAARQRGWKASRRDLQEIARTLAFFTVTPHLKKGAIRTPADLWPLPEDEKIKPIMPTELAKVDAASLALLNALHERTGIPIPTPQK